MNYRGVFVAADNTKRSIYVSLYSMLLIFNTSGRNKEQNEKSDITNNLAFKAAIAQNFDELFGSNSNKP